MPTKNPKVSAYVPKALKDCVEKLAEERDISESQLLTIILAEYFQMPEALGRSPTGALSGGVTLGRMEALEEKLATLAVPPSSIPSELLGKIEQLSVLVESLEKRIETIECSSLLSGLKSEQKEADLVAAAKELEEVISEGELVLEGDSFSIEQDTSNHQLELIAPASSELLVEPLDDIKPIPGIKLSRLRFDLPKDAIAAVKRSKSVEELREWTRDKDPDHIAWKYVESPSKGYVPAEQLSSEQKSSLLKWIKENIH